MRWFAQRTFRPAWGRAARAAARHFIQAAELFLIQNLRQAFVDVLLQLLQLSFLPRRQLQFILQETRQHFTWTRRTATARWTRWAAHIRPRAVSTWSGWSATCRGFAAEQSG